MAHTYVITRHSIRNYGSVLQAYATQRILAQGKSGSTLIDYRQPGKTDTAAGYAPAWQGSLSAAKRVAYFVYRERAARRRGRVFEEFVREELKLSEQRFASFSELEQADWALQNSFFCVGSDQVWNLDYNIDNRPYYLDFVEADRKFSLASSIGMAALPRKEADRLKRALDSYRGVSVREESALEYLSGLGVRNVQQHVDPTLALDGAHWRAFAGSQRLSQANLRDRYVLVYQLNRNPALEAAAAAAAAALGVRVRRIDYWPTVRGRGSERVVLPAVRNFVANLADAELIVTDSFHGSAFAANLGRPLVVVPPPKYATRTQSLLRLLRLENREARSEEDAARLAREPIDFAPVERVLRDERMKVASYIEAMLC